MKQTENKSGRSLFHRFFPIGVIIVCVALGVVIYLAYRGMKHGSVNDGSCPDQMIRDSALTSGLRQELEDLLTESNARGGTALVMHTSSGNMLAACNLVYDSVSCSYRESHDVALHAPGSLFMPILLTAMYKDLGLDIDTGLIVPVGETILKGSNGAGKLVQDREMRMGYVTLGEAMDNFSIVALARLLYDNYLGNEQGFAAMLDKISIVNSCPGYISVGSKRNKQTPEESKEGGYESKILETVTGYGVELAPLAVLGYYNSFVNEGKYVVPHFVKADTTHKVTKDVPVAIMEDLSITARNAKVISGVLERNAKHNYAPLPNGGELVAMKSARVQVLGDETLRDCWSVGTIRVNGECYTCLVLVSGTQKKVDTQKFFGSFIGLL